MDLWAIIPVKPFGIGKSRLAGVLDADQRTALNRWLFHRVFDAALHELGPDRVIVVTTDTALLMPMCRRKAHAVTERPGGDLNAALAQATRYASEHGADAVLILPSDLPDVTGADIRALKAAIGPAPFCMIAPDLSEQGTNALALAPPDAEFFRFGPGSFVAHMDAARTRGIEPVIVRRPGLAHDLDTPESYRRFADRHPDHRAGQKFDRVS